ncbi:MAG: stage V sporulation protein AE [Clostridia bacterium]|nr:stage V sporulation protein AE [Clostridia bacterium]
MEIFLTYLKVFITGGTICMIGQILIDKTRLTPARILVLFVTLGVILTGLGVYEYIVDFGGAGATVPISGFGYLLADGVMEAVDEKGLFGIFVGGTTAAAGGITAAIIFGYLFALISKPDIKK